MDPIAKEAYSVMRKEAQAMESRAGKAAEDGNYPLFLAYRKLALALENRAYRFYENTTDQASFVSAVHKHTN